MERFEHYNQELSADVTAKTEQIASMQEEIIQGMARIIESRFCAGSNPCGTLSS